MRKTISLNLGWLFHKGDIIQPRPTEKSPVYTQSKIERKLTGPAAWGYSDGQNPDFQQQGVAIKAEGWENVNLPHDYVILGEFNEKYNSAHGYLKYENAWYRKHFKVGEEARGKRITLQFGGIAGQSTIYLNGCLMKHNFSTYNSFEIDISNNVYFDKDNVIAVYTNTEEFEGWWYQGSGIYRDVKLVITEPFCIDLYGVYAPYKKLKGSDWQIDFETSVINDSYEDADLKAVSEVLDKEGKPVISATGEIHLPLREKGIIHYCAVITNPFLWDTENPYLYTLKTTLYKGETPVDENYTRIGFRTVELDPKKGMFLNGKHIKINGVCCHQDFGLSGLAITDNVARYKVKLLKEMGANGFRTAHYQHCDATMDALDEMGFIVMNEARWFETSDEAISQLTTLVKRDRNRPSVVFWSTGNEERAHITDVGERVHKALYQVIYKLDKTRFILTAQDREPLNSTVYKDCDVIGINYNLNAYEELHKKYPDKPILASECSASGTSRDWCFGDTLGRAAAYDKDANDYFLGKEKTHLFIAEKDWVLGLYQWVAVDHRGEAVWPALSSKSGSFDLFLQKKGGFYLNKACWSKTPTVHILPHWNFKGLEDELINVTVYSNCQEVELFLNGNSLGRKQGGDRYSLRWDVPYTPGNLTVKAYNGGVLVAEDRKFTTENGEKLFLKQDLTCKAAGSEIALFTCSVLDKNGNPVPTAANEVEFFATGSATVVATGSDPCDHNAITSTKRRMYMGKITVAVKPNPGAKEFELYAKCDGLGFAKIKVEL